MSHASSGKDRNTAPPRSTGPHDAAAIADTDRGRAGTASQAGQPPDGSPDQDSDQSSVQARHIDVRDLMGSAREVVLVHEGAHYRLRITSKSRLILTK